VVPCAHLSQRSKRHLDRLSRFCRAHQCDQQTDRLTDRPAICYVLPVLCMTPCFHVMGSMEQNQSDNVMFRRVRQVTAPVGGRARASVLKSAILDYLVGNVKAEVVCCSWPARAYRRLH